MQNVLAELARSIVQFSDGDGVHATAVPRMTLVRTSQPTLPLHAVQNPTICIIAQGSKQVLLGDRQFQYGAGNSFVVSVDVPVIGQVKVASPEEPYLCIRLDLDLPLLGSVLLDVGPELLGGDAYGATEGLTVADATVEIVETATRMVRLLGSPEDIRVLAPLFERELLYRLLRGPHAAALRQIAWGGSRMQQVNRAIGWIRRNFDQPFSMDALAEEARMSASALHQHFKTVTAMSPLQYQKQLRLQEARRLILTNTCDAATAGHNVGYDSPSQFSREYARMFGAPPLRDIARLRESGAMLTEA